MGRNNRNQYYSNNYRNNNNQQRKGPINARNILPNYQPVFANRDRKPIGVTDSGFGAGYKEKPKSAAPSRSFGLDPEEIIAEETYTAKPFIKESVNPKNNDLVHEDEYYFMEDFLNDYDKAKTSVSRQKQLIHDNIIPLSKILVNYFNPAYADIRGTMDAVFQVMSTEIFSKTLLGILRQCIRQGEDWDETFDNWDQDFEFVGHMVSILLGTKRTLMTEEVEERYKSDIGAGIYRNEIVQLTKETHITQELATDLMLRTPIVPEHMTIHHVILFYRGFLDSMILHAADNVELLNRETQGKIFTFLYGKGKIAVKAIGRFLIDPPREDLGTLEKMIYTEFKCMLYDKLNCFDIADIKFVLKFIVTEKAKMQEGATIVFDFNEAANYNNLNRALMDFISNDKEAKECFKL